MKYIESKLNPDGSFDHTEVRAAMDKGYRIEAFSHYAPFVWFAVDARDFDKTYKYRATIPDTYGIHESSSTLREVKVGAGPAVAEMLLDRIKELEDALSDLIKFAEECDMQIESEWGSYCGSLSDMYDRGIVSREILTARAALNKEQL